MSQHAAATFEIKGWDEKPYQEGEGQAKLTRASVRKAFQGDLQGESTLEYLMAYPGLDLEEQSPITWRFAKFVGWLRPDETALRSLVTAWRQKTRK